MTAAKKITYTHIDKGKKVKKENNTYIHTNIPTTYNYEYAPAYYLVCYVSK